MIFFTIADIWTGAVLFTAPDFKEGECRELWNFSNGTELPGLIKILSKNSLFFRKLHQQPRHNLDTTFRQQARTRSRRVHAHVQN